MTHNLVEPIIGREAVSFDFVCPASVIYPFALANSHAERCKHLNSHLYTAETIGTSPLTKEMGRPEAMLSKYAIRSTFSSMRSASLFRHFPRSEPLNLDHSPVLNASVAYLTAFPMSASLASFRSAAITLSFFGFFRVNAGPVPATHCQRNDQSCRK